MTARRVPRPKDDDAVSTVVGAVLVFSLFATAMVMYSVQTLPQWIADNEQQHMDLVKQRFDSLKGGLDAGSGSLSTTPVSTAVPLAADKVTLLQPVAATGTLGFTTGSTCCSASVTFASNPSLYLVGGQSATTPCSFTAASLPVAACPQLATTQSNIRSLSSLLIGMAASAVPGSGTANGVKVDVADSTAGTPLHVTFLLQENRNAAVAPTTLGGCIATNVQIRTTLTNAAGVATNALLACNVPSSMAAIPTSDPTVVNLLDPSTGFVAALAPLVAPLTLTFSVPVVGAPGGTLTGYYSATWTDTSGLDRTAGVGLAQAFSVSQSGGALQYVGKNQRFPMQTVSYEFGGIVRSQSDGQAMATGPNFQLSGSSSTAIGNLRWTLVRLTASSSGSPTVGGDGQGTATLTRTTTNDVLLTATAAGAPVVALTTPEAAGWKAYLTDQMQLAGITNCAATNPTTTSLAWSLTTCQVAGVTITSWIVHLTLVDAQVTVT